MLLVCAVSWFTKQVGPLKFQQQRVWIPAYIITPLLAIRLVTDNQHSAKNVSDDTFCIGVYFLSDGVQQSC